MRLPTLLSRRDQKAYKNRYGHVLILAGSPTMLGAAALTGLAAMRSGAGLVTLGVPKSLNLTLQKKISSVLMTLPLPETSQQTFSVAACDVLKKTFDKYQAIAIGPGISQQPQTQKFVLKVIAEVEKPLVIDADAINMLAGHLDVLTRNSTTKVLTPHPGEMARITGRSKQTIEQDRKRVAVNFAVKYNCALLLKGHATVVASSDGKSYINKTGNPGMATAGSGDVLTGMIAAFLGQGMSGFDAAKWGAFLHGKAGDFAAQKKSRAAMIAADIIDNIPEAIKEVLKEV